jgi:hypothetical protein
MMVIGMLLFFLSFIFVILMLKHSDLAQFCMSKIFESCISQIVFVNFLVLTYFGDWNMCKSILNGLFKFSLNFGEIIYFFYFNYHFLKGSYIKLLKYFSTLNILKK